MPFYLKQILHNRPIYHVHRVCVCVYFVFAGVDECMVVTLKYPGNRMAVCTCTSAVELPNDAVISGTKGSIRVGHRGHRAD